MAFRTEPEFTHGAPGVEAPRTAVLLCNLGTPDAPTSPALRRYLAEFLGDHRVVEIPKPLWWLILHGIILRVRPAKSAAKYASIWTPEGSPLKAWTARQAASLDAARRAADHGITVRYAMRYGNPSIGSVMDRLRAEGVTRVLVLPLYPQYAGATTASVADAVFQWGQGARRLPELRFVNEYHDEPGYIEALAGQVLDHWQRHGRGERLLLSFHGMPERTLHLGDPYHCQCLKTARLLGERLALPREKLLVTFQSRFGKAKWLEPYTEPTLVRLASEGVKSVDVMCPGFATDCLETLEEIDQEAREAFLAAGGERFGYIPCLNDRPDWIRALVAVAERHLAGWDTKATPDAAALQAQQQRARELGATV